MPRNAGPRTQAKSKHQALVPAVARAIDILEVLADQPSGATLTELSEQLSIPINAVFRITKCLHERGYIRRNEITLRLFLTKRFLLLSQPHHDDRTLGEIALPLMRQLRNTSRETVQLGVRSDLDGVVIEQVDGLHPVRIGVSPGLSFKLYSNAPGKLMLAHAPEAERTELLRTLKLAPMTARTITDREELARECERIRQRGYSTDQGEAEEGIHCVAAGIFDSTRELVAALWLSAPSRRLTKERFAEAGALVCEFAAKITDQFCQ